MHKVDENVATADIDGLSAIYETAIRRFFPEVRRDEPTTRWRRAACRAGQTYAADDAGRRPIAAASTRAGGRLAGVWTSVIFTLIVSVYPGLRVGVSVLLAT